MSCAACIEQRAGDDADEVVYWHVPIDGDERAVTWSELGRWSGHLAVELAQRGLIDHPDVADVVVIGLKDEEWGRRVHALIEAKDPAAPPTADDILGYAKGRLAAYKVPKTIEIVDAIPRSAATKVSRGALVEARGG
jgi:acyl-coenzyme A synthetase/AMP-(fatty) acid ligase